MSTVTFASRRIAMPHRTADYGRLLHRPNKLDGRSNKAVPARIRCHGRCSWRRSAWPEPGQADALQCLSLTGRLREVDPEERDEHAMTVQLFEDLRADRWSAA